VDESPFLQAFNNACRKSCRESLLPGFPLLLNEDVDLIEKLMVRMEKKSGPQQIRVFFAVPVRIGASELSSALIRFETSCVILRTTSSLDVPRAAPPIASSSSSRSGPNGFARAASATRRKKVRSSAESR
jgi:hypothetical protein